MNTQTPPFHAIARGRLGSVYAIILGVGAMSAAVAGEPPVDFRGEIQPILSERCYHCHGPDPATRKGKLRLDRKEDAFADRGGYAGIVAGDPDESEVLRRVEVEEDDPDRMPPASTGKALTSKEIKLLRRWIEQGAPWRSHWAFEPPIRPSPPIPTAGPGGWIRNPIDAFVLNRLGQEGLSPSPEAAPATLLRRLGLDLIGLPPAPDEVLALGIDDRPEALDRAVERLLASPHLGERLAMDWLDAARYADTDGFQTDATRTNWPWRDWVVDAFNAGMPFDRFTIEQFAGDLLPNATTDQKLATGFHRNHMTNGEGGRDPEESRIDYVIDRVNTMGTVWLGLTLGCTQCHGHKFDPISHAEYYQLNAFFDSIDEDGKAGRAARPFLGVSSGAGQRAVANAQADRDHCRLVVDATRKAAESDFLADLDHKLRELDEGPRSWSPFVASELRSVAGTRLSRDQGGVVQASGPNPRHEDYRLIGRTNLRRITALRLRVLPDPDRPGGGLSRAEGGHFLLTDIGVQVRRGDGRQVREARPTGAVADIEADPAKHGGYGLVIHTLDDDPRNGWASFGHPIDRPHVAVYAFAAPLTLDDDEELILELRHRSTDGYLNIGRFQVELTDQAGPITRTVGPSPMEQLAATRPARVEDVESRLRDLLREQFLADHPAYTAAAASLARAEARLAEIAGSEKAVEVMVLAERSHPRPTHVLLRGIWDKKGEIVTPGVPEALNPWPADAPRNRLGLARWLVAPENPLTARVVVNRLWQSVMGSGLVRTPEDFGRQGEPPTHPELLDWLAVEFQESGWDVKHILRLIVTSATYRQSSRASEATRARDPENRLLARANRQRLPSWMIRDAALRSSGLLNPALGGPPVRPYQPDGVWEEMFMGRFHYEPSEGIDQYRRSIHAFWRRSAAPTFLFDSARRRVCEVQTPRTNTPLQALTLLNDQTYLEAARALAALALKLASDDADRVDSLMFRVVSRYPTEAERGIFLRELQRARSYYREHPDAAETWLSHGQLRRDSRLDPVDQAAFAVVADMLLNLDEAISRE